MNDTIYKIYFWSLELEEWVLAATVYSAKEVMEVEETFNKSGIETKIEIE